LHGGSMAAKGGVLGAQAEPARFERVRGGRRFAAGGRPKAVHDRRCRAGQAGEERPRLCTGGARFIRGGCGSGPDAMLRAAIGGLRLLRSIRAGAPAAEATPPLTAGVIASGLRSGH